jgi:nitrogen fixation/metabolism regulation signal transduction histidine kinase
MRKYVKRILAVLLAVVLVVGNMGMAFAEEAEPVEPIADLVGEMEEVSEPDGFGGGNVSSYRLRFRNRKKSESWNLRSLA